jgi:hypothetical protein
VAVAGFLRGRFLLIWAEMGWILNKRPNVGISELLGSALARTCPKMHRER